jgi:hypothetical protein
MRTLLAVLVAFVMASCSKANVEQCDRGCRNYFMLHYWEAAEQEMAKLPEGERAALRAKKESELEGRMMQELDLCVTKCRSGADKHRVQCWTEAKTSAAARKCQNDD